MHLNILCGVVKYYLTRFKKLIFMYKKSLSFLSFFTAIKINKNL